MVRYLLNDEFCSRWGAMGKEIREMNRVFDFWASKTEWHIRSTI